MLNEKAPMKAGWEIWAAVAVLVTSLATVFATLNDIF